MSAVRTCAVVVAAGVGGYLFGACSTVFQCRCAPPPPVLLGTFAIASCDPPMTGRAVVTERAVTIDYERVGTPGSFGVRYAVRTPWRGTDVQGSDLWVERWNLRHQFERWCPPALAAPGRCCGSDTPKQAICANASATCIRDPDRTGWYRHDCTQAKALCRRVKRASAHCDE